MAEGKKSFVLYSDYITIFEELTDEEAGKMVKHLFRYVNDSEPVLQDRMLRLIFEPIKNQLKRDLKDWEAKRSKYSKAGKIGGLKSGESRRSRSKRSDALKNETNEAVTVTDTVTVTVINNTPDSKNEKWNTKPTDADINLLLPELTEGAVIQQYRFTKNKSITKQQVAGLWAVFKAQNFTGEKFYQSPKQVYSHFINWCKTQEIKDFEEKQAQPTVQLKRLV